MFRSLRAAALGAIAFATACGAASAQTYQSLPSTPLLIKAIEAPKGEQRAAPGVAMLSQPIASLRAARLDAATPVGAGFSKLPAGSILSGVQAPDGWAYCAVAQGSTWFVADSLACFQDTDGDGAFDIVRPSGRPFRDVPILVFQLGPPTRLPAPVAWSELTDTTPAAIDYVLSWRDDRKGGVVIDTSLRMAGRAVIIDSLPPRVVREAEATPVELRGARLDLLGRAADGSLRYRVLEATPAQIERITMTVTISPTYVFVVP